MTAERIAELHAIAEAATPGPWTHFDDDESFVSAGKTTLREDPYIVCRSSWGPAQMCERDAAFIATARTALPEALDYIEKLRGEAMWRAFPEYEREMNRTLVELVSAKLIIKRMQAVLDDAKAKHD